VKCARVAARRAAVLIIVFVICAALIAIAGVVISISAKKRRDGSVLRELHPRNDAPRVGRANSDED
jgi:hypothetical protein